MAAQVDDGGAPRTIVRLTIIERDNSSINFGLGVFYTAYTFAGDGFGQSIASDHS